MDMHGWAINFNGFEIANLTLIISVLVATIQRRFTGINPGGLITSAFVILAAFESPLLSVAIILIGLLIARVYIRFFNHIYSGREPMFYMAFMSIVGMMAVNAMLHGTGLIDAATVNAIPSLIVPAILASAIVKQGAIQTYMHLTSVVVVSLALVFLVHRIGIAVGHNFQDLDALIAERNSAAIHPSAYLSIVSILIGFIIYKMKRVKYAGYVILPFLAILLTTSPLNFVLVIVLAAVAYGISLIIRRYSLIIGIGRYAFVVVVSILLAWTAEIVLLHGTSGFSPFLGTTIFAGLGIAVIVNDANVYGLKRSMPALAVGLVSISLVLSAINFTSKAITHRLHAHASTNSSQDRTVLPAQSTSFF